MNNQEAIEQLRFDKELAKRDYISPTNHEEYDLAISALEKQIPKKPSDTDFDLNYFDCPSCGKSIYSSENLKTHKFCLECGQAIDWRNEDE